jgi:type VI secretion system protein ImpG
MDFEVYEVTKVHGFGVGEDSEQEFLPFYDACRSESSSHPGYFTIQREPRLLSAGQKRNGGRTGYIGSEVFLSLVDPVEAPFRSDLRQLAVSVLCTNRDLPLLMSLGGGKTDFNLQAAAPVLAVRSIKGPSKPTSPLREGGRAWSAINHLSLNYLSLMNNDEQVGAAALREMLGLYASGADRAGMAKQIEGVQSIRVQPIVRRLPLSGPIACGRGLEITLEVDELAFPGWSVFLFGAVMEHFFARYASINAFTETVLRSGARGEIMRWPPRIGARAIL